MLRIGTAASSLGAEGAGPAADWSGWENAGRAAASGDGNGFGTRYRDDFALLAGHGIDLHRLTLEWARLQPTPERPWDSRAVEHYQQVLQSARAAGVEVWVTLHHLSLPGWFSEDARGFLDERMARRVWPAHVDRVAETYGDLVTGWVPIEQPDRYARAAFGEGTAPPGRANPDDHFRGFQALQRANREAAGLLRGDGALVICAHDAEHPADEWKLDAEVFDRIGLAHAAGSEGSLRRALAKLVEQLGDDTLAFAITSCGIGTVDEDRQAQVAEATVAEVEEAISDGIEVHELLWWTAIDGYEPSTGFEVPWGVFDAERNPRPVADVLWPSAG